jgi:hypothetical protein
VSSPFQFCSPIDGLELEERLASGTLDTIIPSATAGLYVWCRRIAPRPDSLHSARTFVDWIEKACSKPVGFVAGTLRHMGSVSLTLGGGALGGDKQSALREWSKVRANREALRGLLLSIDYSFVVYVGETEDLLDRVVQHLTAKTHFGKRVQDWGHQWRDFGLRFAPVAGISSTERTAIERLISVVTIAPGTSRSG